MVPRRSAAEAPRELSRSVSVKPGSTLLIVMPGGSSFESVFAQDATAARVRLLTPRFGIGSRTEVESTLTMRP